MSIRPKLQLDYCQVRSQSQGEVVEFKAFVGQRADAGTPTTILDTSEVVVQARVPSDRLAGMLAMAKGQDLGTNSLSAFPRDFHGSHTG